jgi:hypothetical protein
MHFHQKYVHVKMTLTMFYCQVDREGKVIYLISRIFLCSVAKTMEINHGKNRKRWNALHIGMHF